MGKQSQARKALLEVDELRAKVDLLEGEVERLQAENADLQDSAKPPARGRTGK